MSEWRLPPESVGERRFIWAVIVAAVGYFGWHAWRWLG